MDHPITIAHRGEPVGHRENTLGSFAAALELGADWVEIDLRRTRDGEAFGTLRFLNISRLGPLRSAIVETQNFSDY